VPAAIAVTPLPSRCHVGFIAAAEDRKKPSEAVDEQ